MSENTDRAEASVSGGSRFSDGDSGRKAFDLREVRQYDKYASHHVGDGRLFEYDQGRFWVSRVEPGDDAREIVADHAVLPDGPWWHSPVCGCRACVPRCSDE